MLSKTQRRTTSVVRLIGVRHRRRDSRGPGTVSHLSDEIAAHQASRGAPSAELAVEDHRCVLRCVLGNVEDLVKVLLLRCALIGYRDAMVLNFFWREN